MAEDKADWKRREIQALVSGPFVVKDYTEQVKETASRQFVPPPAQGNTELQTAITCMNNMVTMVNNLVGAGVIVGAGNRGGGGKRRKNNLNAYQVKGAPGHTNVAQPTECPECGKGHAGPCYYGKRVCYSCGEPGHKKNQCPKYLDYQRAKSQRVNVPSLQPIIRVYKGRSKTPQERNSSGEGKITSPLDVGDHQKSENQVLNQKRSVQQVYSTQGQSSTAQPKKCPRCGKGHSGQCLAGQRKCFRCGDPGHIKSACPKFLDHLRRKHSGSDTLVDQSAANTKPEIDVQQNQGGAQPVLSIP